VSAYARREEMVRHPVLDNRAVSGRVRGDAPFLLFGHTHSPTIDARMANPGCFLRSAQSFLTMEGLEIKLFQRIA
jgi:predicted phosphodiesterase